MTGFIEVGKNITIAYSSRSDIEDFFSGSGIEDYDFVYAVKSEVPQSMYLDVVRTYALSAFLPSVIIAVCTIFFLFWITRNFVWKKPRPSVIVVVAVIVIILAVIVWLGICNYKYCCVKI